MRSKVILSAVVLFVLSACASPMSLRQGKPDLDEITNSLPERVAGCIGDKLEASPITSRASLSTRPTVNGYNISVNQTLPLTYGGGADTVILVDINKVEAGTHVQVFTHFLTGDGGMPALVKGCL